MELIILIFSIVFLLTTLYRLKLGLFFLLLLLPTYLIRFNIGFLPTTLLEIMIWIILFVWILKYASSFKKIKVSYNSVKKHPFFFIGCVLFLIATTISVFTSVDLKTAAGEWKAFYIEPFLIFLIIITTFRPKDNGAPARQCQAMAGGIEQWNNISNYIILPLVLCGLATSFLAIYQHFTGWMVPWAFWENGNSFRVTGWYGFPNAVGLFLGPLVPLDIYLITRAFKELNKKDKRHEIKDKKINPKSKLSTIFHLLSFISYLKSNKLILLFCILSIVFLPSSLLAILFAKSTGALVGVVAGIGFLLILNKKTRWPIIIIGFLGFLSIFCLSNFSSLKEELTFQDRSGQIRLNIWAETIDFLKDHPIKGAGLASYKILIEPYHTTVNGEGIEIFHHPHNIFLTMWVNLGLLGLIAFIWIVITIFNLQSSIFRKTKKITPLNKYLTASLIVVLVSGLVDSPYIKNDLSILFWVIIGVCYISHNTFQNLKYHNP